MGEFDWKQAHANACDEAIYHPLVDKVMAEFADNMGFALEGLPAYGLRKVAHYAAMVARAQVLGFDPDLLRMTPTEATSVQLRLAAEAVGRGIPVFMIDPDALTKETP